MALCAAVAAQPAAQEEQKTTPCEVAYVPSLFQLASGVVKKNLDTLVRPGTLSKSRLALVWCNVMFFFKNIYILLFSPERATWEGACVLAADLS